VETRGTGTGRRWQGEIFRGFGPGVTVRTVGWDGALGWHDVAVRYDKKGDKGAQWVGIGTRRGGARLGQNSGADKWRRSNKNQELRSWGRGEFGFDL